MRPYSVCKIIYTIQDPDDKTVFGFVRCASPHLINQCTLYAFKSQEVSETKEAL